MIVVVAMVAHVDFDEVIALLQPLARHAETDELLALVFYIQKRSAELAQLAYSVQQLSPRTSSSFFVAGLHFHLSQSYTEATHCYQNTLLLFPQHPHTWKMLGQLFFETGKKTEAFQAFQQALRNNETDVSCHYHMGLLYELLQTPSSSIMEYKLACSYRPYDPHLRVAMGEAYRSMGELLKARECYLVAESLGDQEGTCSYRLGDLFAESDEKRSVYFYRRYLVKKEFRICGGETYRCALILCHYYKRTGQLEDLKELCQYLLLANDEGIKREARELLSCTIWLVCCQRSFINHAQLLRPNQYSVFHSCVFSCCDWSALRDSVQNGRSVANLNRKVATPFKGELIRFDNVTVDNM